MLSGLQIFKYLPAAKKETKANCKECDCPTCMAFALKLAKKQVGLDKCRYVANELKEIVSRNFKQAQKTVTINDVTIGGENVLFRHEKKFVNKTALAVVIDAKRKDWKKQLERVRGFEISRVNENFKVDLIIIKNSKENIEWTISFEEFKKLPLKEIKDDAFSKTLKKLVHTREKAVLERAEEYSRPVYVYFPKQKDLNSLCARASYYICKYANMLVFENFDEALMATLMTLRQNIFTDPEKPLQVEAKVYEFNNPDENSLIFMTTNFALTYFAVANELKNLNIPSYLIVTPAEGMSVLTAWSAEKFTAKIVGKTLKKFDLVNKVKTRKIIIPGLLAHMKEELESEIRDFEMVVGSTEAYSISDFIKKMD